MLLSFQNYLICLFLASCIRHESHTLVLSFWSSGHHLLHYPSCLSVFGKENEHCKEESDVFSFSTTLASYFSCVVLILSGEIIITCLVLDSYSRLGCVGSEAINQRSDLVRVGPFPNYSWKRWVRFLKQHSVGGKNDLLKSCTILRIFY